MIPTSHRQDVNSYSFVGGMLNIAFVTGYIHSKGQGHVNIAINNQESKVITVHERNGQSMPSRFQVGDPIRIKCHVYGRKSPIDDAQQVVHLEAIEYNMPTILDMVPDKVFEKSIRAGSREFKRPEYDPAKFEKVEGEEDEAPAAEGRQRFFEGRDDRMPDASNMVKLAGFVHALMIDRSTKDPRGCLIIHLRQSGDDSKVIPVKCYHRLAMALVEKLRPGSPVGITGYIATRVAPTEEREEDGIIKVNRFPYIRSDNPLLVVTRKEITAYPEWAKQLAEQELVRRKTGTDNRAVSVNRQPANDDTGLGQFDDE